MSVERFHTSVTERQSFRNCRRQWWLEVVRRLRAKNAVEWNLIFGDCVHEALAAYYGNKRNTLKMEKAFLKQWTIENDILKETFGGFYAMGIGDEWVDFQNKGREMLYHYDVFDRSRKFFDKIIAINVEERSFVDIVYPDQEQIPEKPLLSGKIDLVVERSDGIWIWDHKTAMSKPSLRALDVDDQLTAYCYIWYRHTGDIPRGAIYNVLVKEPPHPPKLLKSSGKLSTDKAQRTTLELYLEAIKEHGLDKSDYEDMLNYLNRENRWEQYFVRDGSQRNYEELLSFEARLFIEYQEMQRALAEPELLYPNMSQWNCQNCRVISICQSMEEMNEPTWLIENQFRVADPRISIPAKVASPTWKGVPYAAEE